MDIGVGDLGYGQLIVKLMQDGGRDSHDQHFEGLGANKFVGCRTIGDETKPQQEYTVKMDEHGEELGRFQIDKTFVIQNFIDRVDQKVSHPTRPKDKDLTRMQLMLPYYKDSRFKIDSLKDDMCAITRKDLEEIQDVIVDDPRQRARKEFNHPRDTVMSMIYCMVGDANYDEGAYDILGVSRA